MKKQAFYLILAILLTFTWSFAACSNGGQSSTSGSQAESGTAAAAPSGVASWDTASWKDDTSPITFTCYIDYDWYAVDTWGNDEVSQEITARTGVSLDVTKGSDLNQLGVLLASGDLSDIIFTANNVQRFEDPEVCAPWDELIPQYVPEMMELLDPIEIVNNTKADGHFYTLKTHYNNEEAWNDPRNLPSPGDPGLYFRGDILEAIGNPEIKSIEQLKEVFATVKDRSSELGIDVIYNPHPSWQNALEEFFGITRTPYVEGEQVHSWRSNPNWKEFLLFMNELYRDGYLYKEYLSSRPEDFFQRNRSGKTFAVTYNSGVASETNKIFDEQGIDGYFVPNTEALTVNGETRFQPVDGSVGWSSCFLAADSDKLERLIKYMEFLKSPEGDQLTQWGIEGKHYTLNEDNLLVRTDYYNSKTGAETGVGPWYFQASGLCEGVAVYSGIANPDPVMAGYAKTSVDLLSWRKQYYKRDPVLYFARPDTDTDEFMIEVKLADEWSKRNADIILADSAEAAATLYDEMMAYMESAGLGQLEEAITARYFDALKRYE